MGFMFCDLHVSLNNPSSGDINLSNLPCSNHAPGAKNGPTPGYTCFTLAYIVKNMKKSSCLKPLGLES